MAAATVLGAALWSPGSPRFWISLGVGGVLTALALVIWAPAAEARLRAGGGRNSVVYWSKA